MPSGPLELRGRRPAHPEEFDIADQHVDRLAIGILLEPVLGLGQGFSVGLAEHGPHFCRGAGEHLEKIGFEQRLSLAVETLARWR